MQATRMVGAAALSAVLCAATPAWAVEGRRADEIPPEVVARAVWLRAELARLEAAYRRGVPRVSDGEYDALDAAWRALRAEHPGLAVDEGWTAAQPPPGATHLAPMLSLDKLHSPAAWREWLAERCPGGPPATLVITPKLDGVAVSLVYEAGRLRAAWTRGDGWRGHDVLPLVVTVGDVAASLSAGEPPERVEVRGELVVARAALGRWNAARPEAACPDGRSLAAASVTAARDGDLDPARPLGFVAHGVGAWQAGDGEPEPASAWVLLRRLEDWGLPSVVVDGVRGDPATVWAAHERRRAVRHELLVACDGSVVQLEDRSRARPTEPGARTPRHAVALKFPPATTSTVLRAIELSPGRSGTWTPRALLEPVTLGGVTVRAASLHSLAWLRARRLGPGDRVLVERAGDAVPQVLGVLQASAAPRYEPPTHCPGCGAPWSDGRCARRDCPPVLARRLEHLADGLGVAGLGPERCRQLVEAGLVAEPADLFALEVEQLAGLQGWGRTLAGQLLTSRERVRAATWAEVLNACGIPGWGPVRVAALARRCPDRSSLEAADATVLTALPGVGSKAAADLLEWRDDPRERAELDRLLAALDTTPAAPSAPVPEAHAGQPP